MKRILTVLIIVVWGSLQLFAQQGLITGKVIDETGEVHARSQCDHPGHNHRDHYQC